ncbi:DUF3307 domain-containing protein [Winogradskyella maritima]|uniref:DUF3307 domain-containing protein n=1 Tax=Winogradskyella maritima TaxID=1517766 RepID=A0ABV8AL40_9FLAO|nr:DUF3307 domain-containing protein [Winogradskyella maritima]
MILVTILKLLIAHFIGDFFLQSKASVKHKEKYKLASYHLYLHIVIHIGLMFLVLWDVSNWALILSIALTHLAIDVGKILLQTKKNKRIVFFVDQILHVLSIIILTSVFLNDGYTFDIQFDARTWLILTLALFLTRPTSFIMKTIFTKWNISKLTKDNASLKDAGNYIGILERLLVFVFIITNHWEAVGFLITAKSVFRFGDISNSKERQLTEYILIGTLLSFGIAIISGLIYNYLQYYV